MIKRHHPFLQYDTMNNGDYRSYTSRGNQCPVLYIHVEAPAFTLCVQHYIAAGERYLWVMLPHTVHNETD